VHDHHDDGTLAGEFADNSHDIKLMAQVERSCWFVEQKELRRKRHRLRKAGRLS